MSTTKEFLIRIEGAINHLRKEVAEKGQPKELFTMSELAEFLGVSKATIQRRTDDGLLKPRRFVGRVYYLRSEVLAAITNTSNEKEAA